MCDGFATQVYIWSWWKREVLAYRQRSLGVDEGEKYAKVEV